MKLEKLTKSEISITLTQDELSILNNAMNESLEALAGDENEFKARMGTSIKNVEDLLESINALYQQMDSF